MLMSFFTILMYLVIGLMVFEVVWLFGVLMIFLIQDLIRYIRERIRSGENEDE